MTFSFFWLIVMALATHRLTRLIVRDGIAEGAREWLRRRGYEQGALVDNFSGEQKASVTRSRHNLWSWLFELVSCSWCVSVWTGGGVVAIMYFQSDWSKFVVLALALSSLGSILEERV
jgi:Protein of unknown function (DUF1360)